MKSLLGNPGRNLLLVAVLAAASASAWASGHTGGRFYVQHNLVSDGFVAADHTDANLVNPWGLVFNPNSFSWIADNGSSKSTLYDGAGDPAPTASPLVVDVTGGDPTGIVYNGTQVFQANGKSAPFIFVSENGTIDAWSPAVSASATTIMVPASTAVYKGIAIAGAGDAFRLYATDFHNGKIDVFDGTYAPVTLAAGAFVDPRLPSGYAPFGIQNILGSLYVTYAKQDADAHDDVHGRGFGFVDVYNADGVFLRRLVSRGPLNAPWGIALAPASFGRFSNALLVGNFGDGAINAFDFDSGAFRGRLKSAPDQPITIDGLWAISFGNGVQGQPTDTLFFTAGPADESHGLYGKITPAADAD